MPMEREALSGQNLPCTQEDKKRRSFAASRMLMGAGN